MMGRARGRLPLLAAVLALAALAHATKTSELTADLFSTPKYSLQFGEVPILDTDVTDEVLDDPLRLEVASPSGEIYLCTLPSPPSEDALEKSDAEPLKPALSPGDLLEPLSGKCLYRIEGWWTYEVCFGSHVRQYHEEADKSPPKMDYYLGKFHEKESAWNEENTQGSTTPFVASNYTDGTRCDLTDTPRWVDVRFYCNQNKQPYIASVKEISTCKYHLNILSSHLCAHHSFAPPEQPSLQIVCQPVMTAQEIAEWKRARAKAIADVVAKATAAAALAEQSEQAAAQAAAQVVAQPPPASPPAHPQVSEPAADTPKGAELVDALLARVARAMSELSSEERDKITRKMQQLSSASEEMDKRRQGSAKHEEEENPGQEQRTARTEL